jgi:predicted RNase H-like HicB family nuclease
MMSMRYTVVYEKSRTGWGAYAPDLPGCGATGRTLPLVRRRIQWAVRTDVQGLRDDGLRVPRPRALAEVVETGNAA